MIRIPNATICQIIDYGAEVWGYIKSPKINNVVMKAIQVFLGVNRCTEIPFLEEEMGWQTCCIRRKVHMPRVWNRLLKMDESRLTKEIL